MMRDEVRSRVWRAAEAGLTASLHLGVLSYRRERDLPALVGLDAAETGADSPMIAARILRRLGRALRRERGRGRAGHPDYDLARHRALIQAWRAESRRLGRSRPSRGGGGHR
jgi:hypothetical protein